MQLKPTERRNIMEQEERKAVELKEDYSQVCIWPGTIVGADKSEDFEKWMQDNFGVRAQYLEEYETNPTPGEADTGGRNDVVFALHKEDAMKFAMPKMRIGARWVEDVIDNAKESDELYIYPDYISEYRTW